MSRYDNFNVRKVLCIGCNDEDSYILANYKLYKYCDQLYFIREHYVITPTMIKMGIFSNNVLMTNYQVSGYLIPWENLTRFINHKDYIDRELEKIRKNCSFKVMLPMDDYGSDVENELERRRNIEDEQDRIVNEIFKSNLVNICERE